MSGSTSQDIKVTAHRVRTSNGARMERHMAAAMSVKWNQSHYLVYRDLHNMVWPGHIKRRLYNTNKQRFLSSRTSCYLPSRRQSLQKGYLYEMESWRVIRRKNAPFPLYYWWKWTFPWKGMLRKRSNSRCGSALAFLSESALNEISYLIFGTTCPRQKLLLTIWI